MHGLDWIRTAAVFSRILSKAYVAVFSISATLKSREERFSEIDSLRIEADAWMRSLPDKFRPSQEFRSFRFTKPGMMMIALRIHIMYYGLVISLSRLALHLTASPSTRRSEAKGSLLLASRAIVGLMQQIPQEPCTPMISLTHMPVLAVFILFDYVVHNPLHPETKKNLAFLDVTAGYFSRLDLVYSSKGTPLGAPFGEFATIAHEYVRNQESQLQRGELCHAINGDAATRRIGDGIPPATTTIQNQCSTMVDSQQNNLSSPSDAEQSRFIPGMADSRTVC
jgi:hypothetical protein